MGTRQFKFSYMVASSTATLSDTEFWFKMGIRTSKKVPIASLRHLYVQDLTGGDFEELTVTYESGGKTKKLKLYADKGAPEFHQLADALVELRPEIDLRSLPKKEAFETMGVMDSNKWGAAVAIGIVMAIMLVIFYPWMVHGFDGGHQHITLNNLAKGVPVSTRNLTVSDLEKCSDHTVISETTHKGNTTVKYLLPLVPAGTSCTENEIHVVLETDELSDAQFEELMRSSTIDGMLMNVWWEGLGGDEEDYFNEEMGVRIADDVLLLEYEGDPGFYKLIFFVGFGIVALIMGIVAIVIWVQEKKRNA